MNRETKTDHSTVDSAEIRHFDAMAESWWSPRGDMRTLHMINPVRLAFIRDVACRHFKRDPRQLDCLKGLRFLDIGCGGGILSEPLARIGAAMVGADPSVPNIEVARRHAADSGVEVDYRPVLAEELADAGERFDVVLAMEVVEHVADVSLFVKRCAEMVKPGGLMIAATINRTMKSWAFAIVGAEYILRLLPLGTHHWDKFVTPAELEAVMAQHGLDVIDERGVTFNVLSRELRLSNDMDVNYMLVAERRA
jgi:2-polyprenyl-6-hydroxyphenyl methylase/3-demethylubiquinone-9 3-methyltransferase